MVTMIEVKRDSAESSAGILRRFSKRVSGAGIIKKVKGKKFNERAQSHFKIKKATLKKLSRRAEYAKLLKLGKIAPPNTQNAQRVG